MVIHVYPSDDWIEHKVENLNSCPCEPTVEFYEEETLVIHNSLSQED